MLHKMIMSTRHGLAASLLSLAALREGDEVLGIIELDGNLGDVEKPPILPAGNYTGEIQDVQIPTSQKGNRYFAVKFVIPTDEVPADLADQFEDGVAMYWNRVVVPDGKDRRAMYNLRKFIEAIGLSSATTTVDPNEWMGCKARLKIKHGSWEGEARAEIASVESAEAPNKAATKNAEKPAAAKRGARR